MAIDGNCATFWHSAPATAHPLPASITLGLGGQYQSTGLTYLSRQVGGSTGWIQNYAIYVSTDGTSFTQVTDGTWPSDSTTKYAAWPPTPARYVRLQALSGFAGVASAAEINIAYGS